jgi:hypothetical protein
VLEAKRRWPSDQARHRGSTTSRVERRRPPTRSAPYPWDYVLGSIHFLDGLGIDAAAEPGRFGRALKPRGAATTRRSPQPPAAGSSTR